jgi:hypothetical protein
MYTVMLDAGARTADRLDAARWLADRGFGRAVQAFDVSQAPSLDLSALSTEDLEAMVAIVERYMPDTDVISPSGVLCVRSAGANSQAGTRYR